METTIRLALKEATRCTASGDGRVRIECGHEVWELPGISPAMRAALDLLLDGGATEQQLHRLALERDGIPGLARMTQWVRLLDHRGLVCHTLLEADRPLATLVPFARGCPFARQLTAADKTYSLSRFACCRRDGSAMILESSRGRALIRLHDPLAIGLVAQLAAPRQPAELAASFPNAPESLVAAFLDMLQTAAALTEVDGEGIAAEDRDRALSHWEFHDLLFHTRIRTGRHNSPLGKTFRFRGKVDPQPPLKPPMSADVLPLFRPDLESLSRADVPFTRVLEGRKSERLLGEPPITERQLGEFLYRAARVKRTCHDDLGGVTFRNYPSGGALHELEIYAIVERCENIAPGLYHYDPEAHQLGRLSGRNPYIDTLLQFAWHMMGEQSRPQVLLEITARFQRVQWKYQSIAYSLILKNVGGLYQTMYLVAEAMGLAGCALGGGHADLCADAAGLDYFAESSVGGFVVGSRVPREPAAPQP